MVVAQFECVCRSTALELRSAIKVYVLFCEQFNGHVVNGVDLHFKYDGLEQCFNAGIALHVGVLGNEKRDAALPKALSILAHHVVTHYLYIAPIGLK